MSCHRPSNKKMDDSLGNFYSENLTNWIAHNKLKREIPDKLPSVVLLRSQFPVSVPGKFSKPIKLTMTKSATNQNIFINKLGFLKIDSRTYISSKFRAFGGRKRRYKVCLGSLCEQIVYIIIWSHVSIFEEIYKRTTASYSRTHTKSTVLTLVGTCSKSNTIEADPYLSLRIASRRNSNLPLEANRTQFEHSKASCSAHDKLIVLTVCESPQSRLIRSRNLTANSRLLRTIPAAQIRNRWFEHPSSYVP